MRYINVIVQTILFLVAPGMAIFEGADPATCLLVAQFFLGPWQLVSSLASILMKAKYFRLKIAHQIASWLVLTGLYLVMNHQNGGEPVLIFFLFVAPWTLAIYYYVVTWKVLLAKGGKGKFLPHLSF